MYESVPDDEAKPISQAEEIRNLRSEIRELRSRIDDKHDGTHCWTRLIVANAGGYAMVADTLFVQGMGSKISNGSIG